MAARGGKKRKLEMGASSAASSGGLSAAQKRALLLSAFGTKQQQRGVEAKLRQQFSFDSATMSILENTVHDSKQDESISEKAPNESMSAEPDSGVTNSNPSKNSESQAELDIIPHADLDAETPMDIYPLFDLIPSTIFNLLRQPAGKFLQLCVRQAEITENTRIPRFVLQQAIRINAMESEYLRDRLARPLLYVAVLTRFYTITNSRGARGADNLNYFLEQSESSLLPHVNDFIRDYDNAQLRSKETRRRHGAARRGFDSATYLFGNGSGRLADMCEVGIDQLIAHFRDDFTICVQCAKQMRAKRCVSHRLRDKMLLRILALCLHLSDFNMRLDLLQRDLQLGPGR